MPFGFQSRSILRGGNVTAIFRFRWRAFLLTLLAVCAGSAITFATRTGSTEAATGAILCLIGISALSARAVSRPIRDLSVRLEESNRQFDRACIEFVETMAQALEARDPYTAGHSNRVRDYAMAIARAMHLSPEEVEIIRVGAQLHDIGKIGIPDAVLQKTAYLTPQEYELVKLHPQIGKRILECVGRFEKYLPIVELHHEDQDGGGYPYGLKGTEVPLAVRIVHVADVYDALTSNRAYRDALPPETAQEIIELSAGTQFDPDVVRAFSAIFNLRTLAPDPDLGRLSELIRN